LPLGPSHGAVGVAKRNRLGNAILLAGAAEALQAARLGTCLDTYQAPPLALYALYPPTRHLAVKVRLFIDFLVKRFES
jgi:DNA-binding transcriptional LysR family regulator